MSESICFVAVAKRSGIASWMRQRGQSMTSVSPGDGHAIALCLMNIDGDCLHFRFIMLKASSDDAELQEPLTGWQRRLWIRS